MKYVIRVQKGLVHKYYKREGVKGNYKYYYTKEEYDKAKGAKKTENSILNKDTDLLGDEKEEFMFPVKSVERRKVGDTVSFKDKNGDIIEGNFRGFVKGDENGQALIETVKRNPINGSKYNLTSVVDVNEIKFPKTVQNLSVFSAIEYALENDLYLDAIKDGRMTAKDAKTIIETTYHKTPKNILDLIKL